MVTLVLDAELQPYISQQGASDLPQASWSGKDVAVFTPDTATLLSDTPDAGTALPADCGSAFIYVKGGGIRVRTGGTNPTSTLGLYVPEGTMLTFRNQRQILQQFRFIDSSGEVSEISAMWFAAR